MMPNFESLCPVGEQFFADDEGHVFAYGHYQVTVKGGEEVQVRFIHLWTVRGGKLVYLQQAADSHILQQALTAS